MVGPESGEKPEPSGSPAHGEPRPWSSSISLGRGTGPFSFLPTHPPYELTTPLASIRLQHLCLFFLLSHRHLPAPPTLPGLGEMPPCANGQDTVPGT